MKTIDINYAVIGSARSISYNEGCLGQNTEQGYCTKKQMAKTMPESNAGGELGSIYNNNAHCTLILKIHTCCKIICIPLIVGLGKKSTETFPLLP